MTTDHRKLPRRRGAELEDAILDAALAELAEHGYAGLSVERVAARARTGKGSVYRRWPGRPELAMGAIYRAMPDPDTLPDTGTLRGDLLALLRRNAELLDGPVGAALRGVVSDALAGSLADPGRTTGIGGLSKGLSKRTVGAIVERAVARGEVDPEAVTTRRLEAAPAMLRHQFLFNGTPVADRVIVEIVDEVLVPVFTTRPGSAEG